ncbi:MAG: exo-alpha-sialidase [Hyphomicrobiaceae bacterium]|nr:exo-alpha-sialidase [Hyphomicrobiaceae bacterium]
MHRRSLRALLALTLGLSGALVAAGARAQHHGHGHAIGRKSTCSEPVLACARTVTPAFAADGSLWIVFAAAERVMVARSPDLGRSFEPAVEVTPGPQQLDWGPDSRPVMAVDAQGRVTVAYATFKDKAFNGQVLVARSPDGRSFGPPRPITANTESQRFQALGLDPEGRLLAVWLDKRNRPAARARGETYKGAALVYTWLDDRAQPDETGVIPAYDNTCECCRLGLAFAGPGQPVVIFRNIFPGSIRDHAVVTFAGPTAPGPIRRVSDDQWKTDACPHQGPQISIAGSGSYHAVWFTNGATRQGLFYARSDDAGERFSAPMPLGSDSRMPSRPSVIAHNFRVFLAWKEPDGQTSIVVGLRSEDDGRTWSRPERLAEATGESDHPLLVASGSRIFLSWHSQGKEGYRLIELNQGS